ncbi:MAG: tetratricopeptide repeat protein [Nitrospirota bacterium]|nr:tetratricopeptide repeat protein [Nitrospirota bacterium]
MDACLPRRRSLLAIGLLLATWTLLAQAEPPSPSAAEKTLERELHRLLADHADSSSDVQALVRLADLYLDLGDEYQSEARRRAAYEEGARFAQRAVAIDAANADAHYLYAANLGSAVQLKGAMASALTVNDLKAHVRRALALKPDHAPALHMMGMMFEELPWFLGGDRDAALTHLQRAVAADPHYVHARLDLAKVYIKRQNAEAARRELATILSSDVSPHEGNPRYREEARQLLRALDP